MDGLIQIDAIAFQTRARTIDHLGREQIADCPTAISELWKNSYDAYALSVELHIFDGEIPTAALVDDGHGMSRREFIEKWLVVGTESKFSEETTDNDDRNGLPFRQRQGQKGIGRLSAAALGPLLLVVSKRKTDNFVAALLDWRLFENPFLYLQDVEIPVVDFAETSELLTLLSPMFEKLMSNVWGDRGNTARNARIADAWRQFDDLNRKMNQSLVREGIEGTLVAASFGPRQLDQWPVWSGKSSSGTALIVADITFDLEAQLPRCVATSEEQLGIQARDRLFETLSNFTDPFATATESDSAYAAPEFECAVTAWEGSFSRPVISTERSFGYEDLEELEHVVEGSVDYSGIFRGRVKAFGKWQDSDIVVNPISPLPTRSDSSVGPFHMRLGTFEFVELASSHPREIHVRLSEQAKKYAGLLVYRNGLRVMPYGREDNDFFEIEKRRSQNAGREFWSNRRLFGRIALTREFNPNLKDKAGREGIIDNKAAKAFRDVVQNILKSTARQFFGSDSDTRKELLSDVRLAKTKERANDAQRKMRARKRREFGHNLELALEPMKVVTVELEALADKARAGAFPEEESELAALKERISELKQKRTEFALGTPPANLGPLEDDYREFRQCSLRANELIANLTASVSAAIEKVKPRTQRDVALSALNRNAAFVQDRLRKWSAEARRLLSGETARISEFVEDRNKRYHTATLPLLEDLEAGRLSITQILERLEEEKDRQDQDNSEFFMPYISTLNDLQESVDLDTLVTVSMDAAETAQGEITRLNALAQLGITVEIVGHEIEGLDMTVSRGLREMSNRMAGDASFRSVTAAHESLTDRLRFLSPLKLSGEKKPERLAGTEIVDYISRFFGKSLDERGIDLEIMPSFLKFTVFEQRARIFPVFINLVNNAVYWVGQSKYLDKRIRLDAGDGRVFVSDTGPGVEDDDVPRLFSLFFTRKIRGGRGVGLYLCRANLAAGGHTISYITDPIRKRLSGANFVIEFRGARYE